MRSPEEAPELYDAYDIQPEPTEEPSAEAMAQQDYIFGGKPKTFEEMVQAKPEFHDDYDNPSEPRNLGQAYYDAVLPAGVKAKLAAKLKGAKAATRANPPA